MAANLTAESSSGTAAPSPPNPAPVATTTAQHPLDGASAASKSMPTSRRNSQDTASLWQTLARMNLGPSDAANGVKDAAAPSTIATLATSQKNGVLPAVFPDTFSDKFLFDDDAPKMSTGTSLLAGAPPSTATMTPTGGPPDTIERYLQMNTNYDNFPILVQREDQPGLLSASSAALDLAAFSATAVPTASLDSRPLYTRGASGATGSSAVPTAAAPSTSITSGAAQASTTPPKATITGLKSTSVSAIVNAFGAGIYATPSTSTTDTICKFYLQGYCARGDLCPNSHGQETPISNSAAYNSSVSQFGYGTALGGPGSAAANPFDQSPQAGMFHPSSNMYQTHPGMYAASNGMYDPTSANGNPLSAHNGMHTNGSLPPGAPAFFPYPVYPMFHGQMPGGMYTYPQPLGMHYNVQAMQDGNGRGKNRRHRRGVSGHHGSGETGENGSGAEDSTNRYTGMALEDLTADIPNMCRDQHGCRYLQKKLEEGRRKHINLIFTEVISQVVDLMTDPFGNYLCQKLLEFCGDEQRTVIVEAVAPEMVPISLNMHGTRAVQKLIEFLSNPKQIRIVIGSLSPYVVTLIKDLNGNHVIQKCLNRLSSIDNQFIYDAVAEHCVEVSTHRHGCCVMQRCIDHAADHQKMQLSVEITRHAIVLVQDPFGNYVVQYVLDLLEPRFNEPLVRRFFGQIVQLSMQKFSSNVIEKCIRVCDAEARRTLIDEMMSRRDKLDRMLRDSYANYVVQTALDYAEVGQRVRLVECLRPLLPAVRNTPYGKRIQAKLFKGEPGMSGQSGSMAPGQMPVAMMSRGGPGQGAFIPYPMPMGMHGGAGAPMGGMMTPQFNMMGSSGIPGQSAPQPSSAASTAYINSTTGAYLPTGMFPSPPMMPDYPPSHGHGHQSSMGSMGSMQQMQHFMTSVGMAPMAAHQPLPYGMHADAGVDPNQASSGFGPSFM